MMIVGNQSALCFVTTAMNEKVPAISELVNSRDVHRSMDLELRFGGGPNSQGKTY